MSPAFLADPVGSPNHTSAAAGPNLPPPSPVPSQARALGNTLHAFLEQLAASHRPGRPHPSPRSRSSPPGSPASPPSLSAPQGLSPVDRPLASPRTFCAASKKTPWPRPTASGCSSPTPRPPPKPPSPTPGPQGPRPKPCASTAPSSPALRPTHRVRPTAGSSTTRPAPTAKARPRSLPRRRADNATAPSSSRYAQALASEPHTPVRLALFFPLLPHLLWWQLRRGTSNNSPRTRRDKERIKDGSSTRLYPSLIRLLSLLSVVRFRFVRSLNSYAARPPRAPRRSHLPQCSSRGPPPAPGCVR